MDKITFLRGVKFIEVTTGKKFSEDQAEIYYELLKEIPDDCFMTGIKKLLLERVYTNIPTPAEIISFCIIKDDIELDSTKASGSLRKAIKMYRAGRVRYNFDDNCVPEIIENMGGMKWFMTTNTDIVEKWFQYQFPKMYQAIWKCRDKLTPKVIIYNGAYNDSFPIQDINVDSEKSYIGFKEKVMIEN